MATEDLRIDCAAEAANVSAIRRWVRACAGGLGMAETRVDDLATVASEAASNAVRYAYGPAEQGRLRVELRGPERDELRLLVRDWGSGMRPRSERDLPSLSMGLPIIGALCSGFRLESRLGEGTALEVRVPMR